MITVESLAVVLPYPKSRQRMNSKPTETTVRTISGRFQIGALWKHDGLEFPDSRPVSGKAINVLGMTVVRQQMSDCQEKGYAHKA